MKKLNLNAIRIDGGTQPRERIDVATVTEYAEAIKAGAELPPVIVFHDGADHWLADGFHRWHAHKQAEKASIAADERAGSLLDALLYAVGANGTHGLPRSNADKRKAVEMVLTQDAWATWPETKIAEVCRVSRTLVRSVMAERHLVEKQDSVREVTRGGKTYKQDTTKIGKSQKTSHLVEKQDSPPPAPAPERGQTLPPPAEAPAPADDFDPVTELEKAHAEIQKLTEEIKAAEADDLKAEAIKWRRSYEHAQRQQSEAMDRAKQATDREGWTMKQLRRCGKAVGVDDPKKIAAAVEAMARERTPA